MKVFISLVFFSVSVAQAMPYTCESTERTSDNQPLMRFRINGKVTVDQNGRAWKMHMVGVTKPDGERFIIYGQGRLTDSEIGMTFVQKSYVIGSVQAYSRGEEGIYEGEARINYVNHSQYTEVRCVKDKN